MMTKETELKNELEELKQKIIGGGKIDRESFTELCGTIFELMVECNKANECNPVVIASSEETKLRNILGELIQRIDDGGKIDAETFGELFEIAFALNVVRDKSPVIPDDFILSSL